MPPSAPMSVTVAASTREMQSHSTLPPAVRSSSARWPIAKAGWVPMPITPGPCSCQLLKWEAASAGSVVQVCPRAGTYWRSSSQIGQCVGGASPGANCAPQAVQMKAGISDALSALGGSIRLGTRELDDLGPLLGFLGEELVEIRSRARKHRRAQIGKPRPHVAIGENGVDLVVEPVDDLGGRGLAQADGEPLARLIARYELGHGRNVGQRLEARGGGHR